MPRILRIINRFNLGGPTYNAAYLTRYLPSPYETILVGGVHQESEESSLHILSEMGIEPMLLPEMQRAINPAGDLDAYRKLRKIIKDFKPDIVHTHASKAGFLGRLAAWKEKTPVIVHTFHGHVFHSYFPAWKTAIYKQLERSLAKRSTAIIAISELQKTELSLKYKIAAPGKIEVIPLGFQLERFRQNASGKRAAFRHEYSLVPDEIAVGIIGRLVPVKDHEMFLKALSFVLKNTTRKVRAFIIGDGQEAATLRALADELEIVWTDKVNGNSRSPLVFTSWIKDVDQVLPGLDIVALSSLNEGTPVSLIEAQAAGKPVVTTRVGGVQDVVLENRTALLSEPGDWNSFGLNLLKLVESEELRNSFSTPGWDHVSGRFGVERLISDMGSLYDRLLNR